MRICLDVSILSDSRRTGVAQYNYELIKALLEENKTDQFILFGLTPFATYDYLSNLEFKEYPNVQMKIFKMPARLFRFIFLIWQQLDFPNIEFFTGEVDVFHSFNWFLPPLKKGKIVATVFDTTSLTHPEWHHHRTTQLDLIRFKRIKERADQIVTISKNSRKDYMKIDSNTPIEIVYPAVPGRYNSYINTDSTKTLKKYKLKPGYFLAVSTIEPRKNILNLIDAYLKTGLKEKMVFAGVAGWKNSQIISLINKHRDKIIFTGYVPEDDLISLYKEALCLVYPSYYEGFGLPILEAMSFGTPVICSNTSSMTEVGGNAAIYIDPFKTESIVSALQKISRNKKIISALSKKGLAQSKKFSWKNSAKKMNKIYQKLIKV